MKRPAAIGAAIALLFGGLSSAASAQSAASDGVRTSMHAGLGQFLAYCFSGGLVALLTPCVFPMVPVTVSYFAKREKHHLAGACLYCLGIISTFAVLGVGASVLFGAAGIQRFAADPWVNLGLAALFIALALNLFGVYEFRFRVSGKLAGASRGSSLAAPFLMGLAFSLTSFTCTAPVVGSLLLMSAHGGSLAYPAAGMVAFGLAFSLPFWLLALFPALLSRLPRSGDWLAAVKPALGFVELAAAVKFLSNADLAWQLGLLTRPLFLAIWALIALLLAGYLIGAPRFTARAGVVRRLLGVAAFAAACYFAYGLARPVQGGLEAFLPPSPYPSAAGSAAKAVASVDPNAPIAFGSDYDAAVARAKAEKRDVFVDFTGVTCTNCRWMEDNVFVLPEVKRLLHQMIPVQLYTDRPIKADHENQKLQQRIGDTIALPVYVIVGPDGRVVTRFEGKSASTAEFVKFLQAGVPTGAVALR